MNYWMLGGALVLGWLLISRKMTPEEVRRSKRIKFTKRVDLAGGRDRAAVVDEFCLPYGPAVRAKPGARH